MIKKNAKIAVSYVEETAITSQIIENETTKKSIDYQSYIGRFYYKDNMINEVFCIYELETGEAWIRSNEDVPFDKAVWIKNIFTELTKEDKE